MPCTHEAAGAIAVDEHTGPRADLRSLFELAEDSSEQLDAYIDTGRVLVAVDGDEIVGHLQVTDTGRAAEAEIKNMAVDSSHQGRGIGRALIGAAIALTRDGGRSTLVVATAAADTGNLRFYQRVGFRMRAVERDAFTAATGYVPGLRVDGIELRDRVWLDLRVDCEDRTMPTARVPATPITDRDLYARGTATLLASWEEVARGSSGAALLRAGGVAIAVFPEEPGRGVYNNALLDRELGTTEREEAVDAMQAAYSAAGIERYAAWVHDSDGGMRGELSARGFTVAESTRAMGMALDDIALPRPEVDIRRADWVQYVEYLRNFGLPPGCSAASTRPPSTPSPPPWAARTSLPRSPSITMATAGSSTSRPSRRSAGAGWARRSRRASCTTRRHVAARRRACSRPRWPSGSTRRSGSATSVGSSSTCPKRCNCASPGILSAWKRSSGSIATASG